MRRVKLDRTLGPRVVEWIERNLVHGPGDVQGQRVELDDEQTKFLLRAYQVDDTVKRLVRRAVYSRPKGSAKTELAAMVACAEASARCASTVGGMTVARRVGRCVPRS